MPGHVESYVHGEGRIGVLVEFSFREPATSRTEEFRRFAHEIAMQIAAMKPRFLDASDVDQESWNQEMEAAGRSLANLDPAARWEKMKALRASFERGMCLLKQPYMLSESILVEEHVAAANQRLHEHIQIERFTRYEVPAA